MTIERLCPEGDEPDLLDDGAFWERVLSNLVSGSSSDQVDDLDIDPQLLLEPCAVCGSHTACGYDSEGRALIHVDDTNPETSEGWPT